MALLKSRVHVYVCVLQYVRTVVLLHELLQWQLVSTFGTSLIPASTKK